MRDCKGTSHQESSSQSHAPLAAGFGDGRSVEGVELACAPARSYHLPHVQPDPMVWWDSAMIGGS